MRFLFSVVEKEVFSIEEAVLSLASIKNRAPARDLDELVYFGGCPKKLDEGDRKGRKVTKGQLGFSATGDSVSILVERISGLVPQAWDIHAPNPFLLVVDKPEGSRHHLPAKSELCANPDMNMCGSKHYRWNVACVHRKRDTS